MAMARLEFPLMRGFVADSDHSVFAKTLGLGIIPALVAFFIFSPSVSAAEVKPRRVVSLDFCADQYLLAIAERSQIAAVSLQARSENSYLANRAVGLRRVGENAEDILSFKPDLVLTVWGGGYGISNVMERFKTDFIQLPFHETLEGIRENVTLVGKKLGREERAEDINRDLTLRLGTIYYYTAHIPHEKKLRAIYLSPNGGIAGAGTLMDLMMKAAGLRNLTAELGYKGWQNIDGEGLVGLDPDVIVTGMGDQRANDVELWQLQDSRAVQKFIAERKSIAIDARIVACPTWNFIDGVELIYNQVIRQEFGDLPPVMGGEGRS